VMQADQASTPLKQLYFVVQLILMNPGGAVEALAMFRRSLPLLLASFSDEHVKTTLKDVDRMVGEGHVYEALKAIRTLYPIEKNILEGRVKPLLAESRPQYAVKEMAR
jgi:flagellar protein FlbT